MESSIVWSLKRGTGSRQTFAEWGISSATRRLANMSEDTVDLDFDGASIDLGRIFLPGERLTVYADNTIWFQGIVKPQKFAAVGQREGVSVSIAGPWYELERVTYTQARRFVSPENYVPKLPYPSIVLGQPVTLTDAQLEANNAVLTNLANYPTYVATTGVAILGQDSAGNRMTTMQVISAAVAMANNAGVQLQLGTLPAAITAPIENVRDASCADVISKMLRWTPDITVYFDYATSPPTMRLAKLSAKSPFTLSTATSDFTNVDLQPAEDMQVPGVRLDYIKRHTRNELEFWSLSSDVAGNSGLQGAIRMTIELQGGQLQSSDGTVYTEGEPAPVGIAASLYSAFSQLYYRGSVTIKSADCRSDNLVGRTLNISGLNPQWATMAASIERQTDVTATGQTTIEVGPPARLGPTEVLELVRTVRNLRPVSAIESKSATTGGAINYGNGSSGSIYGSSSGKNLAISYVDSGNDTLFIPNHGLKTGDAITIWAGPGGTMPGGLSSGTTYYAGVIDGNTIKLYTSRADAVAGTNPVNITSSGSGNLYATFYGSSAGDSMSITSVSAAADTLTIPNHGLHTGDSITLWAGPGGTLPGGLTSGTTYYVKAVDGNTVQLFNSRTAAQSGTNPVNITSSGSGSLYATALGADDGAGYSTSPKLTYGQLEQGGNETSLSVSGLKAWETPEDAITVVNKRDSTYSPTEIVGLGSTDRPVSQLSTSPSYLYYSLEVGSQVVGIPSLASPSGIWYDFLTRSKVSYSGGVLDFSSIPAHLYKKAVLTGTLTQVAGNASPVTTTAIMDVTAYLGASGWFAPQPPTLRTGVVSTASSLAPSLSGSASISFDKLVLYPVTY